ncbi:MAG: tetratricopeptide repeat protein [Chryseolinea sp.]
MKKIVIAALLALPAVAFAQKEVKPNINKALSALKSGKYDEAKSTIDAATTYEKTMNDGKTWFYRGLIYGALDTTSVYKATEDLTSVAAASFKKAEELSGGKASSYFIQDANGSILLYDNVKSSISQRYLYNGDKLFAKDQFKEALTLFEKGIAFTNGDTVFYQYAGYAAYNGDDRAKAVDYLRKYVEKGGRQGAAMTMAPLLEYEDKNFEQALTDARAVLKVIPTQKDMKIVELNSLIELKRYDEASKLIETKLAQNPNDAQENYLLGMLNNELGKEEEAKKSFENALKADPKHFESALALAKYAYKDAKTIKDQMNALSISAADKKKRYELDAVYVEKLKAVLPYWERCEKLNPTDQTVLDALYLIYSDLDNKAGIARIEKRYKELGVEN